MEVAQLVLEIIIVIIGFYLALFKSYFQEKGKNLATKEDVEEITQLVEKIKNQIHYNTQSELSLRTEERNALVNYYDSYNYWLRTVMNIHPNVIWEDNDEKLTEFRATLYDAKFKYDLAEGRKDIFVNNQKLVEHMNHLKTKTLEIQCLVLNKICDLEYLSYEMRNVKKTTPIESRLAEVGELIDKNGAILNSLGDERIEKYTEVASMNNKFQNLVFLHLQSLIKKEE